MKNLKFIYDKELELALYKYSLLLKRDFLYDLILDEFIILESLFTKGGRGEVAYRLSSNLAFFLAKDIDINPQLMMRSISEINKVSIISNSDYHSTISYRL